MEQEGIPVNDLYAFVKPNVVTFICDDKIHLSEAGRAAVGQKTVEMIREQLKKTVLTSFHISDIIN